MESSFASRNAEGKIERYQGFLLDMTERGEPRTKYAGATGN